MTDCLAIPVFDALIVLACSRTGWSRIACIGTTVVLVVVDETSRSGGGGAAAWTSR